MTRHRQRPSGSPTHKGLAKARRELNRHPDNAPALFRLTCLLLEQGDSEANQYFPMLERFPDYGEGWCQLGDTLARLQRPEAALAAYRKALKADGPPVGARIGAAQCLLRGDEAPEALSILQGGGEQLLQHPRGATLLGRALYRTGAVAEAGERLHQAVTREPKDAEAWYNLGRARQDLGAPDAAADAYARALALRPDLHQAALNQGIARQEAGDLAGAEAAFREAVRIEPATVYRALQALTSASTGRLFLRPRDARRFLGAE